MNSHCARRGEDSEELEHELVRCIWDSASVAVVEVVSELVGVGENLRFRDEPSAGRRGRTPIPCGLFVSNVGCHRVTRQQGSGQGISSELSAVTKTKVTVARPLFRTGFTIQQFYSPATPASLAPAGLCVVSSMLSCSRVRLSNWRDSGNILGRDSGRRETASLPLPAASQRAAWQMRMQAVTKVTESTQPLRLTEAYSPCSDRRRQWQSRRRGPAPVCRACRRCAGRSGRRTPPNP